MKRETVADVRDSVEIWVLWKHIDVTAHGRAVWTVVLGNALQVLQFAVPVDLWYMLQLGDIISTKPSPGALEYEAWAPAYGLPEDLIMYFTRRLDVPLHERHFALCKQGVIQVFDFVPERLYLRRLL